MLCIGNMLSHADKALLTDSEGSVINVYICFCVNGFRTNIHGLKATKLSFQFNGSFDYYFFVSIMLALMELCGDAN